MAAGKKTGGLKLKIKLGGSNAPGMNKRSFYSFALKTPVSSKMMRCVRCRIEYQTQNEFEAHLLSHIYSDEAPTVNIKRLDRKEIREWRMKSKQKRKRTRVFSWNSDETKIYSVDDARGGTTMRIKRVNRSNSNENVELENSESLDSNLYSSEESKSKDSEVDSSSELDFPNTQISSETEKTEETAPETLQTHPETVLTAPETVSTASETLQTLPETPQIVSEPSETHSDYETTSETAEVHSEAAQDASDTRQTSPEISQTASDTRQTSPEVSQTASDTQQTSLEVSQTASDTRQTYEVSQTASEILQTQPEGFQTASETLKTHPEGFQTASETTQTHPEGFQTASETTQTRPEGFLTASEGSQNVPNNLAVVPYSNIEIVPNMTTNCLQPLLVKSVSVPLQFTQNNTNNQLTSTSVQQNTLVQQQTTVLQQNLYIQQNWIPSPINSSTSQEMVMPILQNQTQYNSTSIMQSASPFPSIPMPQLEPQISQISQIPLISHIPQNNPILAVPNNPILPVPNNPILPVPNLTMSNVSTNQSYSTQTQRIAVMSSTTSTVKANLPSGYKCSMCSVQCRTKVELDLHTMSHKGSHLTCDICGFVLGNYNAFREHRLIHQGDGKESLPKDNRLLPAILRRPALIPHELVQIDDDNNNNSNKKPMTISTGSTFKPILPKAVTFQNIPNKETSSNTVKTISIGSSNSSIIPINSNSNLVSIINPNQQQKSICPPLQPIASSCSRVPVIQNVVSAGITSNLVPVENKSVSNNGNNNEIQTADSAISQILKNQHLTVMPINSGQSSSMTLTPPTTATTAAAATTTTSILNSSISSNPTTETNVVQRPPTVPTPLLRNKELTITPVKNCSDVTCLGNFKSNSNITIRPVSNQQQGNPSTSSNVNNTYLRRLLPNMSKAACLPPLVPISTSGINQRATGNITYQTSSGNYQKLPISSNPANYQKLPISSNPANYQKLPISGNNSTNYQKLPVSSNAGNYQKLSVSSNPGSYPRLPMSSGGSYQNFKLPISNNPANYQKLPNNSAGYSQQMRNNNFSKNTLLPGNRQFAPYPITSQSTLTPINRTSTNTQMVYAQQNRNQQQQQQQQNAQMKQQMLQQQQQLSTQRQVLSVCQPRMQNATQHAPSTNHPPVTQQNRFNPSMQQQEAALKYRQEMARLDQMRRMKQMQQMEKMRQQQQQQQQQQAQQRYQANYQPIAPRYPPPQQQQQQQPIIRNNPPPSYNKSVLGRPRLCDQSVNVQSSCRYNTPGNNTMRYNVTTTSSSNYPAPISSYQQSTAPQWHQPQYPGAHDNRPKEATVLMPPPSQPPPRLNPKYANLSGNENSNNNHPVRYMSTVVQDVESLTCGICSRDFANPEELSRHLVTHTKDRETDNTSPDILFCSTIAFSPAPHSIKQEPISEIEDVSNDFGIVISSVMSLSEEEVNSGEELIILEDETGIPEEDLEVPMAVLNDLIDAIEVRDELILKVVEETDSGSVEVVKKVLESVLEIVVSEENVLVYDETTGTPVLSENENDDSNSLVLSLDDEDFCNEDDISIEEKTEDEIEKNFIVEESECISDITDTDTEVCNNDDKSSLTCYYCDCPFDKLSDALEHVKSHVLTPEDLDNEFERLCLIYFSKLNEYKDKREMKQENCLKINRKRKRTNETVESLKKRKLENSKNLLAKSAKGKYSYLSPSIRVTCISCGKKFGHYKVYLQHKRNCNNILPPETGVDSPSSFPLSVTIPSSLRDSSMVIPVLDLQKAAIDTLASCGVTTFIPLSCNGSNGGKCGLGIPVLQGSVLVNSHISNRLKEMGVVNVVPLDPVTKANT